MARVSGIDNGGCDVLVAKVYGNDAEEIEEHGRLIAAAPEFYATAKEVMDLLSKHGASIVPHLLDTDENPGERLRALLAKVKAQR
jgi:pantothenate kinase